MWVFVGEHSLQPHARNCFERPHQPEEADCIDTSWSLFDIYDRYLTLLAFNNCFIVPTSPASDLSEDIFIEFATLSSTAK